MKKSSHHESAKGIIGLLVVAIGFVLFYKLATNQDSFVDDLNALRYYVVLSILAMGFLLGLFYLVSRSTHQSPAKKSTKKKKS